MLHQRTNQNIKEGVNAMCPVCTLIDIKEEKIKLLTRFKFLVKVIKFSILNAAQRFSSKGTL